MTDSSAVLVDGPWRHLFVAANGARFHVAELDPGRGSRSGRGAPSASSARRTSSARRAETPLVVLLHGFGQMWWAWRHQLPALADAGYRTAAIDLRGAGASDKPPQGYDIPTLARDVAGVIRSLGANQAVVVGHGVGGTVAWSMPTLHPEVTRAVAALSAPHPATMHTGVVARALMRRATARRLAFFQLPYLPERRMTRGDLAVRLLREWGAPGWLDSEPAETAEMYRLAAQVPFAAHSGMETLRWLVRSTPRVDGQRYLTAVRSAIDVPVLQVHGEADRCIPVEVARSTYGEPHRFEVVPDAGHYLPEEAPGRVDELLVDWLGSLSG